MKTYGNIIAIAAIFLVIFVLGGLAHEADIRRQCLKNGHAGYAGWLGNFECHISPSHK